MKKSFMKKTIVGVLVVLAVVVFMKFLFTPAFFYQPRLTLLMQYVSQYIKERGQFPDNYDALKRFINEKGYTGEALMLDKFMLYYDFNCDDAKVVDGRLYNKTNEEIFLISGPFNHSWRVGSLKDSYRTMSLQWYNLILYKTINQYDMRHDDDDEQL